MPREITGILNKPIPAIVPFLHGGVTEYKWLTEHEFIDAVAMITPGPVVITVGFIG